MNIIIFYIVIKIRGVIMNKKLLISLLSVLVLSTTVVFADDTTTTNTRPEPPKFENGTPPDFVKGQGVNGENDIGNPPRDFKGGQNGQFAGRRPSKKPDSQPGGKMEPKEWDTSSNNGQNFQGGQPPQFDGNNSNGRPPMPPKQDTSTTSSES